MFRGNGWKMEKSERMVAHKIEKNENIQMAKSNAARRFLKGQYFEIERNESSTLLRI